jgi:hypothetical protein
MNSKTTNELNNKFKPIEIKHKKPHPLNVVSTYFLLLAEISMAVVGLLFILLIFTGSWILFGFFWLALAVAFIMAFLTEVFSNLDPTPRLYETDPPSSSHMTYHHVSKPTSSPRQICNVCHGSGRCTYCRGTGLFNYYYRQSPSMHSSCTFCVGTGACSNCNGKGFI